MGIALCALLLAPACVVSNDRKGVANSWREVDPSEFVRGETSRGDVLALLGPPSQLIDLGEQTVFYYLLEETESVGAIMIFYNRRTERVRYDRAIFFFDQDGVLSEYSFSDETIQDEADDE